jgi:hypothetical protein
VIYTGHLGFKDDMKEVASGYDCGLNIENFNDIKVGDFVGLRNRGSEEEIVTEIHGFKYTQSIPFTPNTSLFGVGSAYVDDKKILNTDRRLKKVRACWTICRKYIIFVPWL